MTEPQPSDSEMLCHPRIDLLLLLSKHEHGMNPYYLTKELGLMFANSYSHLRILEKAGLIRHKWPKYHITPAGSRILMGGKMGID